MGRMKDLVIMTDETVPNGVWVPADRVLVMDMRILMDCDLATLSWSSLNDLWANTEAIIAGNCYCSPAHTKITECTQLAPAGVVRTKITKVLTDRVKAARQGSDEE